MFIFGLKTQWTCKALDKQILTAVNLIPSSLCFLELSRKTMNSLSVVFILVNRAI